LGNGKFVYRSCKIRCGFKEHSSYHVHVLEMTLTETSAVVQITESDPVVDAIS
jgi:hypothetical protein